MTVAKIVYLIDALLSLRTSEVIDIRSEFSNDIQNLRRRDKPKPRPHIIRPTNQKHPVKPYINSSPYAFSDPSTFPIIVPNLEYFKKPYNYATNTPGNFVRGNDQGPLFRWPQLPSNCKIMKSEPGMPIPLGAVRIPASLFRPQLDSREALLTHSAYVPRFRNFSPVLRQSELNNMPIQQPMNTSPQPIIATEKEKFPNPSTQTTSESFNSKNESIENNSSSVKDNTSPYSTLGSSCDSYNIQIQLPK